MAVTIAADFGFRVTLMGEFLGNSKIVLLGDVIATCRSPGYPGRARR